MYPAVWAQKNPDKAAFVNATTGESVTYGQLDERSNQLAHHWRGAGLIHGDRVAILMENNVQQIEVIWAALRSGLVVTPINWHLVPDEVAYIVADSGARALVTSHRHAALARTASDQSPELHSVLCIGEPSEGLTGYLDAIVDQPTTPIADERRGTDMIYTSGTTGRPKGGIRPLHDIHPAEYKQEWLDFFARFGLGEHSTYLSPGAPLYHGAPLRFSVAVTSMGGTVVTLESFDAQHSLRAIDDYAITHSQWVPTMFVRMLRLPAEVRASYTGSQHACAIHAAAPCPAPVKEQMIDWWGPILTEYYGGSEGGVLTMITTPEWMERRGSVGRPVDGTIHITDDDGNPVGPHVIGSVRFEGGVPVRYHNDDAKTAGAYDQHGWSSVGDLGHLDADGYLYLADRADFMINSGGVNIYPREIEDVLLTHPEVVDVAVFGIPNDEFGQEVKAVVQPANLAAADDALVRSLQAHVRDRLAGYKCPRTIEFEPELPRSAAGKLAKRELQHRYTP